MKVEEISKGTSVSRSTRRRKKARIQFPMPPSDQAPPSGCILASLPFEVIATIATFLTTQDLMALAYSSLFFYRTLAQPQTAFIWRAARDNYDNAIVPAEYKYGALPPPPPGVSEVAWAHWVLQRVLCPTCNKKEYCMVGDGCRIKGCEECHKDLNEYVESARYIYQMSNTWLALNGTMLQYAPSPGASYGSHVVKKQWERAVAEYERKISSSSDVVAGFLEELKERRSKITELHASLKRATSWYRNFKRAERLVLATNFGRIKSYAQPEKWEEKDFRAAPTILRLLREFKCRAELITEHVWKIHYDQITSEIEALAIRRINRVKSQNVRDQSASLDDYWRHMKSTGVPYPPLSHFKYLDAVKSLREKSFRSTPSALSNPNSLESQLIDASVAAWMAVTKEALALKLGVQHTAMHRKMFTAGYGVHPVETSEALFVCTICRGSAKWGKPASQWAALDFKAVCGHVCGKKGGVTKQPLPWSLDNFAADEEAIALVKQAELLKQVDGNMKKGGEPGAQVSNKDASWFQCDSCIEQVIVLEREDLTTHTHHHSTGFKYSPLTIDEAVTLLGPHPIPRGTVAKFTSPGSATNVVVRKQAEKKMWSCRHCLFRVNQKVFSFHGMVSHLLAAHLIRYIGDEDFFKADGGKPGETVAPHHRANPEEL